MDNYHNTMKFNIINPFPLCHFESGVPPSLSLPEKNSSIGTKGMRNLSNFHFLHPPLPIVPKGKFQVQGRVTNPPHATNKGVWFFPVSWRAEPKSSSVTEWSFWKSSWICPKGTCFSQAIKAWTSLTITELILYSASPLPHAEQHQFKCCHPSFSLPTILLSHQQGWGEPSPNV